MSGCRDLLFNVMEHRFSIPQIAAFLNDHDLSFLGFEPFEDPTVIEKFHEQFAGSADEADLDQWHRFEADHPGDFQGHVCLHGGQGGGAVNSACGGLATGPRNTGYREVPLKYDVDYATLIRPSEEKHSGRRDHAPPS